jgi:DNA topoisomerase-1
MSEKPLLIVESPSKASTISGYLGGEYDVIASVGHVKDLPANELGIDIENDFKISLKVLPGKKEFFTQLKKKAKVASRILLATDPDREGEAIAAHISSEIPHAPVERVQFTEITKSGIQTGIKTGHPIDMNLVDAQQARRIIDRLVGYKISPVLWSTLQKNMSFVKTALSAGRVQSAAVKILIMRERERAGFSRSQYYDLKAQLTTDSGKMFAAVLHQLSGKRIASGKDFDKKSGKILNKNTILLSQSQADALVDELQSGTWRVDEVEKKPGISKPRPPFTTSTLQQEAARQLGFTTRRAMRVAQQLYEAGFITYMRTDSTHLSGEALNAARQYINDKFGKEYLTRAPIRYTTKVKNAQEAHEAIRPAGSQITPDSVVANRLGNDGARLYALIRKRTVASQMPAARIMHTTAFIQNQEALFRARGKIIEFPGYMLVYVEGRDDPNAQVADKEIPLPDLKQDQTLYCNNLSVEEHETKPPARFTEAALVKEMEKRGIGRPSTYASIIDVIQRREYAKKIGDKLIPTYLATAVTQLLENHFEPLVDIAFTANMEDRLDAISRGELQSSPFIKSFYYGNDNTIGLETMLEAPVDIRRACTVELGNDHDNPIALRIGNFGPYLQKGDQRRTIPSGVHLGDLSLERALEILNQSQNESEILGKDPESSMDIQLKEGPYGLYVQIGDTKKRKAVPKEMRNQPVDLDLALKLLALPRNLGNHPESNEPIQADYGRYGPYIRSGRANAPIPDGQSPLTITLEEALTALANRTITSVELRTLGSHPETGEMLVIKKGRYGPYITDGKVNAALGKRHDPETLTLEEAVAAINKRRTAGPRKKRKRKKK